MRYLLLTAVLAAVFVIGGGGGVGLPIFQGQNGDSLVAYHVLRPFGLCKVTATAGDEDAPQPDLGSFTLLDGFLPTATTINFKYNPDTFPSNPLFTETEFVAAVNAAGGKWNTAAPFTAFGTVTEGTDTTNIRRPRHDGTSLIAFGGTFGGVAVAFTFFDPDADQEVEEVDIILAKGFPWDEVNETNYPVSPAPDTDGCNTTAATANVFDLENALAHEMGHPLRLGDLLKDRDAGQTMFGLVRFGERYKRTLGTGDTDGAGSPYNFGQITGTVSPTDKAATIDILGFGTTSDATTLGTGANTYDTGSVVPPSTYDVKASATGCISQTLERVTVPSGGTASGINFTLSC